MKVKVSISLDEKTVENVDKIVEGHIFRNRSHFVEYSIKRMLGDG